MQIEEMFEKAKRESGDLHKSYYEGKDILFFAVKDWIDTGYMLAKALGFGISEKYSVLAMMGSGTPVVPCDIGYDIYNFFLFDFKLILPDDLLLVYPEHKLVPNQQRHVVNEVIKNQGAKRIVIITTSEVIISDALRECVSIVTEDCIERRAAVPVEKPGLMVLNATTNVTSL